SVFDLILVDSLFSSQYAHHNPHLHSFPTRRSSDLTMFNSVPTRFAYTSGIAFSIARAGRILSKNGFDVAGEALMMARSSAPSSADRKSTRLNSSHVSISYAVFCLKKKNLINMRKKF